MKREIIIKLQKKLINHCNRKYGTKNNWPLNLLVLETLLRCERCGKHAFKYLSNPQLFTEKIPWYALFYHNPVLPRIVDKVSFKSYVEDKLGPGYTIPLLHEWDSFEEMEKDWDKLPEKVAIKSNSSGDEMFSMIITDKSKVDFDDVREEMKDAFNPAKMFISSYRWAYHSVKPRVLAEEYRTNANGKL